MPSEPNTARLRQLNVLLDAALGLPTEELDAWLATLPAHHHTLLPELRSLLARAHVETDSFMRRGAHTVVEERAFGKDAPGDIVGPYRLLNELGQGGMSTVWRARRNDDGLQREVALKLPYAAWSHGIAQRMARERDILASLEHPRIARLYDAGVTSEGRPWLAMECVEGASIDRHCQEHALPVRERLALFLQVADAVAYAHCQLVVHRDLKPSNILVTPANQVRLLDFGVAKLMERDAHNDPQLTQQIGRPITPDYAAPEQLGGRAVGTAADVYSLGVVLFELLCDARPYSLGQMHGVSHLEEALLRTDVPPVSRRATDKLVQRALRGDLDAIVAKAMAKQPGDRYLSVEAFAADVQRHLDGHPVVAQAPLWRYRAAKFVHRNRLPLATATLVSASVLVGLGVALWQADVARTEATRAQRANELIMSVLERAGPRQGSVGAVMATDLLSAAGERIDTELASEPKLAVALGVMIGERLHALGDPQRAIAPLRSAVARSESLYGRHHPLTVHARAALLNSFALGAGEVAEGMKLADELVPETLAGLPGTAVDAVIVLRKQSVYRAKLEQAEASYASLKQAIELAERHLGADHEQTLRTVGLLSSTYGRFGQHQRQLEVAQQAYARAQQVLAPRRPDLTLTHVERWYAEALRDNGRPGDATAIFRRVLEDQRALDGADTQRVRTAMVQLGVALGETGQLEEALKHLRDAVALEARQNNADNEDRRSLVAALAGALGYARRAEEAQAQYDNMRLLVRPLSVDAPLSQVGRHVRYAQMLGFQGQSAAAIDMADGIARMMGDQHLVLRVEAWAVVAMSARLQRQGDKALRYAQRAWNDPVRALVRPSGQAVIAGELAAILLERGDHEPAAALVKQSLALFEQAQVTPSPRSSSAWIAAARLHLRAGRAGEALRLLEPVVASWQAAHPGSAWHGEALHWSSVALDQVGRTQEAAAQRQRSRAMLRASTLPMLRALAGSPVVLAAN